MSGYDDDYPGRLFTLEEFGSPADLQTLAAAVGPAGRIFFPNCWEEVREADAIKLRRVCGGLGQLVAVF